VPSEKHETILRDVVSELRKKGYLVYRLDKRNIPDAFYIDDNGEAVAVEIETDIGPRWTRWKKGTSNFQKIIVVGPVKKYKRDYSEIYFRVFELRKKGKTQLEIKNDIEKEFGVKLGQSTISEWLRGKYRPYNIHII